jgi:hypothetical protein
MRIQQVFFESPKKVAVILLFCQKYKIFLMINRKKTVNDYQKFKLNSTPFLPMIKISKIIMENHFERFPRKKK